MSRASGAQIDLIVDVHFKAPPQHEHTDEVLEYKTHCEVCFKGISNIIITVLQPNIPLDAS